MIIVSVEKSALLMTVDRIVGGVEVEDQVLGRRRVGGEELIDQSLGDLDQSLTVDAVLQSAESRGGGEYRVFVGHLAGGELEGGVIAEVLMVVEVFVAQGNGRDSLGDHGFLIVDEEDGMSGIGDGGIDGVEEAGLLGHLAEQEGAGIGGESTAPEIRDDVLGSKAGKTERLLVTVCHGDGLGY